MAAPSFSLKESLIRTPFFGGLEEGALDRVVQMLVERKFERDQPVFKEGDAGRSMYIVRAGQLLACRAASGSSIKLRHFQAGDFFGEMTLIEMQPRPYTVRVEQAAELYELTSADLYRLYREDVKAYVLILQNVNRELCRRVRSSDTRLAELAAELGDEDRTQIGSLRPK